MSDEAAYARKLVAELEKIELNTGSDIRKYTERVRRLSRALAMELEYSAQELEAGLRDLPPASGQSRIGVRKRSKQVAKHLRRAAEAQRLVGVEGVRTWGSVTKHFGHLIRKGNRAKKRVVDLDS
ncbi:hypothetical protein [Nocardiopsis kunsanensis]|uniref:hypothetical protein n=1 Tax=Nocardiopsis kunsanensis TaxID=141693 RepID=UPI000348E2CE|nr:hypothetical protein [Nocardiopsis kunsanensis]